MEHISIELILGFLSISIGYLLKTFHKQAMDKLDEMISSIKDMSEQLARHDEKLIHGDNEFKRISEHQKEQDKQISNLDKRVAKLEP